MKLTTYTLCCSVIFFMIACQKESNLLNSDLKSNVRNLAAVENLAENSIIRVGTPEYEKIVLNGKKVLVNYIEPSIRSKRSIPPLREFHISPCWSTAIKNSAIPRYNRLIRSSTIITNHRIHLDSNNSTRTPSSSRNLYTLIITVAC